MDRILLSAVQSQGKWRLISTELSPDTYKGRPPHPRKEVEAAVQSLKKGKSAGVDNIPAELVKAAGGSGFFFASEDFEKNVRQFIPRCAFL